MMAKRVEFGKKISFFKGKVSTPRRNATIATEAEPPAEPEPEPKKAPSRSRSKKKEEPPDKPESPPPEAEDA